MRTVPLLVSQLHVRMENHEDDTKAGMGRAFDMDYNTILSTYFRLQERPQESPNGNKLP